MCCLTKAVRIAKILFEENNAARFEDVVVVYLNRVYDPKPLLENSSKLNYVVDEDTTETADPYVSIVRVAEEEN